MRIATRRRTDSRPATSHVLLVHNGRRRHEMLILKWLWKDEQGQDLTEYALLLVLIALIAVASLKVAGQAVSDAFSNAAANLTTNT